MTEDPAVAPAENRAETGPGTPRIPAATATTPISELLADALWDAEPPDGTPVIDVVLVSFVFRPDADPVPFVADLKARMSRPGEWCDVDETRMRQGPGYVELGSWIGSQQSALEYMALGAHHGVWDLITPVTLGFEADSAETRDRARRGMLMVSGLREDWDAVARPPRRPADPTKAYRSAPTVDGPARPDVGPS